MGLRKLFRIFTFQISSTCLELAWCSESFQMCRPWTSAAHSKNRTKLCHEQQISAEIFFRDKVIHWDQAELKSQPSAFVSQGLRLTMYTTVSRNSEVFYLAIEEKRPTFLTVFLMGGKCNRKFSKRKGKMKCPEARNGDLTVQRNADSFYYWAVLHLKGLHEK